jgi:hypothetical protein
MKECTFKPDLITAKSDLSKSIMTNNVNESKMSVSTQAKYEQLYQLAKHQKVRQDKTKEDYEYERNKEELTFAPKIQSSNMPQRNTEQQVNLVQDKFVQKQIDRLNKGREEKERVRLFMEKGIIVKDQNPNAHNESTISAVSKKPAASKNEIQTRRSPRYNAKSDSKNSQS